MAAQVVEQHLLAFAVTDGLGSMVLGTLGLLAQNALMQAAGEHILVGDTVIDVPVAVVVGSLDRFLVGLGDIGLDDRLAVDVEDLERHGLLGAAIHLRGGLDHVDLLLAAHPGDVAVVLDTDEQVAAAVVGKG